MASLAAVRDAIKSTIDAAAITGLRCYDTAPDAPQFPCVVIIPSDATFDQTFGRGQDEYTFDLDVMAQGTSERAGQDQLDALISGVSGSSVRAAIWSTPTLGLVSTASRVTGFRDYGVALDAAGARYFRAVLELTVQTKGTA